MFLPVLRPPSRPPRRLRPRGRVTSSKHKLPRSKPSKPSKDSRQDVTLKPSRMLKLKEKLKQLLIKPSQTNRLQFLLITRSFQLSQLLPILMSLLVVSVK